MNYEEILKLDIKEQVNYINNLLSQNESLRSISTRLSINKSTISSLFKKSNYIYDGVVKQFINNEVLDSKLDNKPQIVDKPVNKPILNIPFKNKTKTETKAFNIVVKLSLVNDLDKTARQKGYSRNELINYMLNFCNDNMDK